MRSEWCVTLIFIWRTCHIHECTGICRKMFCYSFARYTEHGSSQQAGVFLQASRAYCIVVWMWMKWCVFLRVCFAAWIRSVVYDIYEWMSHDIDVNKFFHHLSGNMHIIVRLLEPKHMTAFFTYDTGRNICFELLQAWRVADVGRKWGLSEKSRALATNRRPKPCQIHFEVNELQWLQ